MVWCCLFGVGILLVILFHVLRPEKKKLRCSFKDYQADSNPGGGAGGEGMLQIAVSTFLGWVHEKKAVFVRAMVSVLPSVFRLVLRSPRLRHSFLFVALSSLS